MGTHRHVLRRTAVTGLAVSGLAVPLAAPGPGVRPRTRAGAARHDASGTKQLPKVPVMTGSGGAVASVDRDASQVGIDVLASGRQRRRRGRGDRGRARRDRALSAPASAAAGSSSTTTPARSKVRTIDGRETAPRRSPTTTFTDARRHRRWTSTPWSAPACRWVSRARRRCGTQAARDFGTRSLRRPAQPAERLAAHGLRGRPDLPRPDRATTPTGSRKFPATAKVFLPGGKPPGGRVGLPQPRHGQGLPRRCARRASTPLYRGELGADARRGGPRTAHRRRRRASWAGRSPRATCATTAR